MYTHAYKAMNIDIISSMVLPLYQDMLCTTLRTDPMKDNVACNICRTFSSTLE